MNNLVQRYLLRDILSDYVSQTATTDDGRGVTQMSAVTLARTCTSRGHVIHIEHIVKLAADCVDCD